MLTQDQTLKNLYTEMPGSSRIWIYQANRFLTEDELILINNKASDFVKSWESHGSSLRADFTLLHNLFLIFAVDENQHGASGCSIDKSVNFVKEIQNLTGINFFDRTMVAYFGIEKEVLLVSLIDFKKKVEEKSINQNTLIFNNLIQNLNQINSEWIIPAGNSWLSRFF